MIIDNNSVERFGLVVVRLFRETHEKDPDCLEWISTGTLDDYDAELGVKTVKIPGLEPWTNSIKCLTEVISEYCHARLEFSNDSNEIDCFTEDPLKVEFAYLRYSCDKGWCQTDAKTVAIDFTSTTQSEKRLLKELLQSPELDDDESPSDYKWLDYYERVSRYFLIKIVHVVRKELQ